MGYNTFLLRIQSVELQSHLPSCFTWEVFLSSWLGLNVEMPPEQDFQQLLLLIANNAVHLTKNHRYNPTVLSLQDIQQ